MARNLVRQVCPGVGDSVCLQNYRSGVKILHASFLRDDSNCFDF